MATMNIGLQRRIGVLPRTPEYESPSRSGYFGYSHAGFKGQKPTPRYEGFFGIGTGYYGNEDEGQSGLPVNGFYGSTSDDDEALVETYLNGHYLQMGEAQANNESDASINTQQVMANQVTASEGFVLSQNALMIGAGLALILLLRK